MDIYTKEDLKKWILIKQGDGVINQEYTEAQLESCIDDAIDWYFQHGGLGSSYINYLIVTKHSDENMIMPDFVKTVIKVFKHNAQLSVSSGSFTWSLFSFFSASVGSMKLADYVLYQNYLSMVNFETIPPIRFSFGLNKELILYNKINIGETIAIEYAGEVPKNFQGVYNHVWIKHYALALANLQWGLNISKYGNITLQGGITLNGESIRDTAREDITKLEEDFYRKWYANQFILFG